MSWFRFKKKNTTYTYKLVKNGGAVDIGTTNNPHRRNDEHSRSGKNYDYLITTSRKLPRSEAGRRETRNLRSYKKATGRRPRYNKTSNGKFNRWY